LSGSQPSTKLLRIMAYAQATKLVISIILLFTILVMVASSFSTSEAQMTFCPNSGVECTITITDPDGSSTTVESQKGANDPALIIERMS